MSSSDKGLETKVGFFVLLGLALLAAMVVQFGRLGEGFKKTYQFAVEFPNASGIYKDAEVLMAGARVGRVKEPPKILEQGGGVYIELSVYEEIRIPSASTFHIGSSGLLGDRFVDVRFPSGGEVSTGMVKAGDVVKGKRETGFDDITREGTDLIRDLRGTVEQINGILTKLDKDLLKEETFQGLEATITNLKDTSSNFSAAAEKLNDVMDEAKVAASGASATMQRAQETVEAVQGAVGDARKAIGDARDAIAALDRAVTAMTRGSGLIARLLVDKKLADDVQALIANLRQRGVLFYRDQAGRERPQQDQKPERRRNPIGPH